MKACTWLKEWASLPHTPLGRGRWCFLCSLLSFFFYYNAHLCIKLCMLYTVFCVWFLVCFLRCFPLSCSSPRNSPWSCRVSYSFVWMPAWLIVSCSLRVRVCSLSLLHTVLWNLLGKCLVYLPVSFELMDYCTYQIIKAPRLQDFSWMWSCEAWVVARSVYMAWV